VHPCVCPAALGPKFSREVLLHLDKKLFWTREVLANGDGKNVAGYCSNGDKVDTIAMVSYE